MPRSDERGISALEAKPVPKFLRDGRQTRVLSSGTLSGNLPGMEG
jgi:hypothetical protein